ncbi:MAG: hypothetical protein WAO16_20650, partial [Pseudolabrys sp.]
NRAAGRLFLHKALRNLHATPAVIKLLHQHGVGVTISYRSLKPFGFVQRLYPIARQSRYCHQPSL